MIRLLALLLRKYSPWNWSKYSQSHLGCQAQSSNISFATFQWTFDKRSSNFGLWARNSIRKCHPKWDRLYIFGSIVNDQNTTIVFIFTILLIQSCIQINYYNDKNHVNSTVMSFPRKNADWLKKSRTRPDRWARRCTAAVFYPNWRTSGVHHKKGRPRAATSHESRLGKPSFALLVFARGNSIGARTDNSIDTELGKLLG